MVLKFEISLLVYICYLFLKVRKEMYMLQQNRYNDKNRYINWVLKNPKKVWLDPSICFLILFIFLKINNVLASMATFVIIYMISALYLLHQKKKEQTKLPFKITARVKRLLITTSLIYLIPMILFITIYVSEYTTAYYLVLGFLAYLAPVIVLIANIINVPIEKLVFLHFKKKAKQKLHDLTNMEVIGITGSYGKTTSKNVVYDILSEKYTVMKTPKNYNTPNGLLITINQYLDKFNELFVAEMGACRQGEIKELCDLVKPKYGIVTKIGKAHLETFGSEEAILKTKMELIEALPHDGIGILNGDDIKQKQYKIKNTCRIVWIGVDNQEVDFQAKNIVLSKAGSKFDVFIKKENKSYPFQTKLLGKVNIYNILAGIALGYELGIPVSKLQNGVKKIVPVEHRLSMFNYYGLTMLDDTYNSNPVGFQNALEVLKMMPGKKIVITPGMIELGSQEKTINEELGRMIAKTADEVILVGANQTKPLQDGLKKEKFDLKKLHVLNDVMEAYSKVRTLQEGDTYVLMENDLPDIFNEE